MANNGVDRTSKGVQFVYHRPVVVANFWPGVGPETGGTKVTITGHNFMPYPTLSCRFASAEPVAATWVNSETIVCIAPAGAPGQVDDSTNGEGVAVSVTNNLVDFAVNTELGFKHEPSALVLTVAPQAGPLSGGTMVSITGTNFVDRPSALVCRFGDVVVAASFVSSEKIRCESPKQRYSVATTVSLDVALNGADFNGGASYTYVPPPVVKALVPSSGMLSGGTTVRVVGSHLGAVTNTDAVMCRFGSVSVPAQVESASSLLCETPDLGLDASVAVAVEVTTNSGGHYSDHGMNFLYQDVPDIFSLSPPQGVELGGYEVTVTGSGFLATPHLACRFHSTIVQATMVSSSVITCAAPAHTPMPVCVDVTLNGVDFSDCSAKFTYSAAATMHSLYPAAGPVGGGTEVTITGTNFEALLRPDAVAYCSFGDMRSEVHVRSPTEATCTASPLAAAGNVQVQLLVGRALASESSLAFRYTNPALLYGLYPSHGRIEGGTDIVVTGTGFNESQPTLCFFDPASADGARLKSTTATVSSVAKVVSDTEVLCTTPAFPGAETDANSIGGFVVVDIASSSAGHRAASQGLVFWYRSAPTLASLSPFVGRVGGGTKIVVTGSGWLSGDADLSCQFGTETAVIVPALVESPTTLTCVAPAAKAPGGVRVGVSTNGADWVTLSSYTYADEPTVTSSTPTVGPVSGGTVVTVEGTGFVNVAGASSSTCRFGSITVNAIVESETKLTCVAPPLLAYSAISGSAEDADANATVAVEVGVSNNGVEYSAKSGAFAFAWVPAPAVVAVRPNSAPVTASVDVTVMGANLVAPGSSSVPQCRLASEVEDVSIVADGSVLDATSIVCNITCPDVAFRGTLEVSTNGVDYTSDATVFSCGAAPTISAVDPTLGPAAGGTVVTISGKHFERSPHLACRFGDSGDAAAATWLGPEAVTCVSPAVLESNGPEAVSVAVSNNGHHFFSSPSTFSYHPVEVVTSTSPAYLSVGGGTTVTVSGYNFIAEDTGKERVFMRISMHTNPTTAHTQARTHTYAHTYLHHRPNSPNPQLRRLVCFSATAEMLTEP